MPNHFHFQVEVRDKDELSQIQGFENLPVYKMEDRIVQGFSDFFNSYTKAFNVMYHRKGKLFLAPFKRKPSQQPTPSPTRPPLSEPKIVASKLYCKKNTVFLNLTGLKV